MSALRAIVLLPFALCLLPYVEVTSAQTDLDAFMARVLERRDGNWKKLQQYVLDEREAFQLTGPGGARLYGFRREYTWFPRDGVFVKSPVSADGVALSEDDRRRAEDRWLRREEARERRARERRENREPRDTSTKIVVGPGRVEVCRDCGDPIDETGVRDALEPGFVSAAYFLRFKFDPGHYALAGREQRYGRELLRIEYYPTRLFEEGRTRPNKQLREEDEKIGAKMNKVSLVTLWIDPNEHQIVEYDFENVDMDFLPARSILRIDRLNAAMRMDQPFPDVWLPASLGMRFGLTMAIGSIDARYDVNYHNYRLATTSARLVR